MQGGTERGIIEHTKRRRRRRRGGMDHGWKDYGFSSLSQPVTRVVGLFSRIGGGWLKLEGGRGRERSLQAELLALTPSARAGEGEGERFPSGWVENLARPLPPPAPPEAEDSSSSFSRKPAPIRASQLLSSIFFHFFQTFFHLLRLSVSASTAADSVYTCVYNPLSRGCTLVARS